MNTKRLLLLSLLSVSGAASSSSATAPDSSANDNDNADANSNSNNHHHRRRNRRPHHLSRIDLSKILHTSLEDEATLHHYYHGDNINNSNRKLQEDEESDKVWDRLIQHGWTYSKNQRTPPIPTTNNNDHGKTANDLNRRNLRSGSATSSAASNSSSPSPLPFLICSTTPNQSGYQRRSTIAKALSTNMLYTQVVYNTQSESCFIVTTTVEAMELYEEELLVRHSVESDELMMVEEQVQQASFGMRQTTSGSTTLENDDGGGGESANFTGSGTFDPTTAENEQAIVEEILPIVKFGPLLDFLKLPTGTAMSILSNPSWSPPPISTPSDVSHLKRTVTTNEFSYNDTNDATTTSDDASVGSKGSSAILEEEVDVDVKSWRRSILIELLPGAVSTTTTTTQQEGETLKRAAESIVEFVKDMAMVPPYSTTTTAAAGEEGGASSYLRNGQGNETSASSSSGSRIATEALLSTREAFSLTSTDTHHHHDGGGDSNKNEKKRTFHNPHSIWSTALHHGFESLHGCQVMLDTLELEVSTPPSNGDEEEESTTLANFELILHPPSQYMKTAAVESSAWNKYCAVSLLIGLSVHPLVSSVEVGVEVELASMSMSMDYGNEDGNEKSNGKSGNGGGSNDSVPLVQQNAKNSSNNKNSRQNQNNGNNNNNNSSGNQKAAVEGITNPQWIVQSGVPNSRPFFDVGLDGSGQVVAVADGGLDQDNCYFQSSSSSSSTSSSNTSSRYASDSKGGWDMTQRKIVHYDDTFGDRSERTDGHGTYVSSILAGKKSLDGGEREVLGYADGSAPGSKLAFFDMENGYFGIRDSGADRLFKSLYNNDNIKGVKGARVINASWGRSYHGQYTSFCRSYDAFLRNKYPDLLFVVSAGNTGRSGASSIQDPADCKNPMAVGATLSSGSDLRRDELGIEYLADYSSRGPAQDGRMKPDICAPGHFVLSARANPDMVGECDGDTASNAARNELGGPGVKYTTGTSMAAPVLAGSAAIIRQYFEEGYCNPTSGKCCGYKGCGSHINPSGSLLKAILMNGAQPLKGGVQYVPSGEVLQEPEQQLRAYDSNQGMGRVNLSNSVPLAGENQMSMMIVNDKPLVNGEKDIYTLFIDESNGCTRELSATLSWYDPPGTPGCTRCLINDLDVSIKQSSGVTYPNGRRNRDTVNTVERVQTEVTNGEEVRIIVDATNLSLYSQKYSLAITGCISSESNGSATEAIVGRSPQTKQPTERPTKQPTKQPTKKPTKQPQAISAYSSARAETITDCSDRLFKVALSTGEDGQDLSWSLIGSTNQGGIERLISGGGSGYSQNEQYVRSACLDPGKRYRFQVKNTAHNNISGRYKLTYAGKVVFNARGGMGRASTFRFKTEDDGSFKQLGSNTFETHVSFNDETEVPIVDLMLSEATFGSNDGVLQQGMYDKDSRDDSNDPPSAWNDNKIKTSGRGMLDDDMPGDENELQVEYGNTEGNNEGV